MIAVLEDLFVYALVVHVPDRDCLSRRMHCPFSSVISACMRAISAPGSHKSGPGRPIENCGLAIGTTYCRRASVTTSMANGPDDIPRIVCGPGSLREAIRATESAGLVGGSRLSSDRSGASWLYTARLHVTASASGQARATPRLTGYPLPDSDAW